MTSLKPKLIYQLAVSFLYSAAPIIVFPYLSRVLGPENIGKINFIDYTVQFFIILASFGIPFYGAREISRARESPALLSRITSELAVIHILISLISLILFTLLIFFKANEFTEKELVILAVINIASSAFGLEWFIHGLEDFRFLARRSFLVKIGSLVAVFLFIRQSEDYILYYVILAAGNLLVLLFDLAYALRMKLFVPKGLQLRRHLKPLSIFFLTSVTLSIYTFFDTVILGFIAGSLAVGYYTTSLKIIRILHNFINDLGGVLLPRVSFLVERGHQEEVQRIINKSLQYVLTITIPLSFFLFVTAEEIIGVLGGSQFLPSVPVLRILSLVPLVMGLCNIFFVQVLLPFGRERTLLLGVLIGTIASVASNLLLCPLLGERGAALSCLIAETFVTVFLGIHALRKVRLNLQPRQLVGIFVSTALFYPLVYGLRLIIDGDLLLLSITGAVCLLLYALAGFFIFSNPILLDIFAFFKGYLRPKSDVMPPVTGDQSARPW